MVISEGGDVTVCELCKLDMLSAAGCEVGAITVDGRRFERVRYGREDWQGRMPTSRPCGDCGAALGSFHHLDCDFEECPRCGGQLIGCGCGAER